MNKKHLTEHVSIFTTTFASSILSSSLSLPLLQLLLRGEVASAPPLEVTRSSKVPRALQDKRTDSWRTSSGCTLTYSQPQSKQFLPTDEDTSAALRAWAGAASQQKKSCIIYIFEGEYKQNYLPCSLKRYTQTLRIT